MSDKPGPSPKKCKVSSTSSQPTRSPKKFSPKKYYGQKRYSPKKKSPGKSPKKRLLADEETSSLSTEGKDSEKTISRSEAYYSCNFKEVLSKCLLLSNPERHVIREDEVAMVEDFMALNGGLG